MHNHKKTRRKLYKRRMHSKIQANKNTIYVYIYNFMATATVKFALSTVKLGSHTSLTTTENYSQCALNDILFIP